MDKVIKFSDLVIEHHTLFCSPLCFKNSIYSPQPKTKTEPSSRPTHHNQTSEENSNYCSECNQKLLSKYYYHKTKHDQEKFCSKDCFTEFYGERCSSCGNKFLEIYPLSETQPEFTYCWDCLQRIQAEEAQRKAEQEARFNFDGKKQVQKILEAMKKGLKEKFERENQEQAEKEAWEKQERFNNQAREREREREREQNQPRTEQNPSSSENQQNLQNPNDNLKSQINSLESEIKALESNQTNKNLLNAKKAELEELKKQQQIQSKQSSNTKLYLGIGLGVLGGGIIGLVIYLIAKKKNND